MPDLFFTPAEEIENFVRPAEREATPSTGGETFGASFANTLNNGPLANLLDLAQARDSDESLHDAFFKDLNRLKSDPLGAILYDYKKIFNSEPTEKAREARRATQEQIDDILSRSTDGFLSGLNKFAGSSLGFLADPINLAATIAAPELVGARAATAISGMAARSLTPRAASLAGRLVGGALEGSAITLPSEAFEAVTDEMYDDDFNALNAVLNIGMNAAIGSLAGFFHLKEASLKGISTEGAQQATQDAVAQMMTGNAVDVGVPIRRGFKEARLRDNVTVDQVRAERADLIKELETHTETKSAVQREVLDKALDIEPNERLTLRELHHRISRIQSKAPENLLPIEKQILERFEKTEDFKQVEKELSKPEEAINPDAVLEGEKAFDAEVKVISERTLKNEEDVQNLQRKLKEVDPSEKEAIQRNIDSIERKVELDKKRLNEIENFSKEKPVEEALQDLDKAEDTEGELLTRLDELNTIEEMLTHEEKGLTGADVKKYGEGTLNGEKESGIDIKDDSLSREAEEVENEGAELRDDQEKAVNDFLKEGEVPEELREEIDAVNDEVASLSKYNRIINSMADCIIKNVV